jgi:hypothetical protein
MSISKKKETVSREQEVIIERTCDLCGVTCRQPDRGNWGKKNYDEDEVAVTMKTGTNYPDGGNAEEVAFDLCPSCFRSKLVPWLESQGAMARVHDWSW